MKFVSTLLFLFLSVLFFQCSSNDQAEASEDSATSNQLDSSQRESSSRSDQDQSGQSITAIAFPQLDFLDINKMQLIGSYAPEDEEGDCTTTAKKYQYGTQFLAVDYTDCYDYGKSQSYYLLDAQENIKAYQEIGLSNELNTAGDGVEVIATETILVFKDGQTFKKERKDTLENAVATTFTPFAGSTKVLKSVEAEEWDSLEEYKKRYSYYAWK
ncbi:MAG: hypothetical protein AAF242_01720 [Bacteroidota bacterium]